MKFYYNLFLFLLFSCNAEKDYDTFENRLKKFSLGAFFTHEGWLFSFKTHKFIQIDNLNRHPSQLYEAIFEGLILFIILNIYKKKLINPGLISSLFLMIYSIFRFFIEYTREPDNHLGLIIFKLSMGQIISLITLALGIFLFYLKNKNEPEKINNSC